MSYFVGGQGFHLRSAGLNLGLDGVDGVGNEFSDEGREGGGDTGCYEFALLVKILLFVDHEGDI